MPKRSSRRWMPRMHGAAVQCCMCIVGVFMFLGGVIMLATGISLILNYGVFDITLLPPDLNNEEGKQTVGIILTVCGLIAIIVSVIVSVLYLCNKTKSSINPDDLSRIPNSTRNNTPDRPDQGRRSDRSDRRHVHNGAKGAVSNGGPRPQTKNIPGSAEVIHPPRSHRKRHRHKYPRHHPRRLEEIKEDAISRKTVDGALINDDYQNDTPRSGSMSSQATLEDNPNSKIPKVVLEDWHERPGSVESGCTSQTSDTSSYTRFMLENDKSRREFQFMPDNVRNREYSSRQYDITSKDSASLERYDETSLIGNNRIDDDFSINSGVINPALDYTSTTNNATRVPTDYDVHNRQQEQMSAGGNMDSNGATQSNLPRVLDSVMDESITGYKMSHYTELHGEQTVGRISPQINEPETYTSVVKEHPEQESKSTHDMLT